MKFENILLIGIVASLILWIMTSDRFFETFEANPLQQSIPTVTVQSQPILENNFEQIPEYLGEILKNRNNHFLIYNDNQRQNQVLNGLEDEVKKLTGLIGSLSNPIQVDGTKNNPLQELMPIENSPNHYY